MTMFLSYSGENAVLARFWKCFFKSCGIWVEKKEIGDYQETSDKVPYLMILDPDIRDTYQYEGIPSHVCILADSLGPDYRKFNLLQNKEKYKETINRLFSALPEHVYLEKLLDIFLENHFWEACWMNKEFAKENVSQWDENILEICDNTLFALEKEFPKEESSAYVQYMRFYCRYIQCGTEYRSLSTRLLKSKELLNDFRPLVEEYKKDAMFQHLAGRICELNCVLNKQAVYFYQKAVKRIENSEYFYDIGHSFEKVYGDEELALHFYKKAYSADRNNYRALYKLAVEKEIQENWTEAFAFYSAIRKQLNRIVKNNYDSRNADSVVEIDYAYKVNARLHHIYRQIFGCGGDINSYTKSISEIKEKFLSSQSFEKLAVCMGNEKRGEEIVEELQKRFQGACYQ